MLAFLLDKQMVKDRIGAVEYKFAIQQPGDAKKVLVLLTRSGIRINGQQLKWQLLAKTPTDCTVVGTFKPITAVPQYINAQQWMMERYGISVNKVLPYITLISAVVGAPKAKVLKPNKFVSAPRKRELNTKKTIEHGDKTLSVYDFLEQPLDPNIPHSKQYAYTKAWRLFNKARRGLVTIGEQQ